jgi:predicted transcriptional regulator of viral defense system
MRRARSTVVAGAILFSMIRCQKGRLTQLSRGLYQLPDAALDANHSLAVAAKLVPNGVICHDSALAFHDLTDRIPPFVWVAIGPREWRPKITQPRIQIERFGSKVFGKGIEHHTIEGVSVPMYSPAKTIVDLFKSATHQKALYKSPTGFAHATQGMKEALRLRKATPAEIAKFAVEAGIWEKVVQPRLEGAHGGCVSLCKTSAPRCAPACSTSRRNAISHLSSC